MRFLTGLNVGFLLAIGVAYVHDSSHSGPSPEGAAQTLVNWDVFGREVAVVNTWVQEQIARLNGQLHRQG